MTAAPDKTNPKKSTASLLLVLLTRVGGLVGAGYHTRFGATFVSRSEISLEPKARILMVMPTDWPPPGFDEPEQLRHDQLIMSSEAIFQCLKDFPELRKLPSLDQIPLDQVAAEISRSVTVTPDSEVPYIYMLAHHGREPYDGAAVLSRLIESYRKSLDARVEKHKSDWIAQMIAEHGAEFSEVTRAMNKEYGYRFSIFTTPIPSQPATGGLLWSMFAGATIGLSVSAASLAANRRFRASAN